jgi:hypothetical protein
LVPAFAEGFRLRYGCGGQTRPVPEGKSRGPAFLFLREKMGKSKKMGRWKGKVLKEIPKNPHFLVAARRRFLLVPMERDKGTPRSNSGQAKWQSLPASGGAQKHKVFDRITGC